MRLGFEIESSGLAPAAHFPIALRARSDRYTGMGEIGYVSQRLTKLLVPAPGLLVKFGNPLAQLTDRRIERLLAVIDGWIDRLTFSAGRSRLPL